MLLYVFSPVFILASPLVLRSLEEVDRLFKENQKQGPFLLGKGNCLQRGKKKGKDHGTKGEKENEDLDHPSHHLGRGQGHCFFFCVFIIVHVACTIILRCSTIFIDLRN